MDTFDPNREQLKQQIEQIIFPQGARTESDRRDVQIVANAKKYGCILVTLDGNSKQQPGGILGHRQALFQAIRITVMTDDEAAALVSAKIQRRDQAARNLVAVTGEPLPEWVGKD